MRRAIMLALLGASALAAVLSFDRPSEASAGPFGDAKVRLYSEGKLVGEWMALGRGRVEGNSYVFTVRKGVRDLEVRISGTFSVEQQP